jgi:transcriptional regulator with XRE-family HTH domain
LSSKDSIPRKERTQANIPQKERCFTQNARMRQSLDKKLAKFLRQRRGETPYAAFAKKLGIRPSSLFRLENCQQSITLKTLQQLLDRLKCRTSDIFKD